MTSPNFRPSNNAEKLVQNVFRQLEGQADPQIARLHFENKLRRADSRAGVPAGRAVGFLDKAGNFVRWPASDKNAGPASQFRMRPSFRLLAVLAGLFLLGSWASNIEVSAWDDGQQVTISLPRDFSHQDYIRWVAVFANRSESLAAQGGHSLVVDYIPDGSGGRMLQLNMLGVDYSTANEWVREVLDGDTVLKHSSYAITQPLVRYDVRVRDLLTARLRGSDALERGVVQAWAMAGSGPTNKGMVYLIARNQDYARRASMVR